MSESKIEHIINKGNNLVNKIKEGKKKTQLIDITKDYDKIYDNKTKLKYKNAKDQVIMRWTKALKKINIQDTSEEDLFKILQKIKHDVAYENNLIADEITFNGGKKRKSRRRLKKTRRNRKNTKRKHKRKLKRTSKKHK